MWKKNKDIEKLKNQKKKASTNYNWIIKITLIAFIISILFTITSESIIPNVPLVFGILLVIIFIFIGALFDMIGVAVASASAISFHSMSAKKIRGSTTAVNLIKNADKVSSFCNDVIGDISGIVSGSAGVIIAVRLSTMFEVNVLLLTLLITSLIASITIGSKALGKSIAINKSNYIVYEFAKIISYFSFDKK
jgi:CBS domain containing-hemolysin-like protein